MDHNGHDPGEDDTNSCTGGNGKQTKTAHKRSKGKSRVWEKVAWFTRRSKSRDYSSSGAMLEEGATAAASNDISAVENIEEDLSPTASNCDQYSWIGSSSSSESGEMFEMVEGCKVKRSRLYPNSEIVEQNCLKPSIARALFHQIEAASCRGNKPPKYLKQIQKKRHSVPWKNLDHDKQTGKDVLFYN